MRIVDYIKLIRVYQWYKNVIIFLPLFFTFSLFSADLFLKVLIGFIALCMVSSANYVLNDIIDRKRDRAHPEKRLRPLASGRVSVSEAIVIFLGMLSISIVVAIPLGFMFLMSVLFLFVFTLIYTFFLKHEPIADVISIAINFVVRAIAGALILKVVVSPWLVLCPFFLAMMLVVGKREADLKLMKDDAKNYKKVLSFYTPELIHTLMIVSITSLILSYALYSFSRTPLMLLTVPITIYGVLRYYYLVMSGSPISRHPEKVYKDWRMMIAMFLWAIVVFAIFYVVLGKINLWALV